MSDHGRSEMEALLSGRHRHKPEVPIVQHGVIVRWACRCGATVDMMGGEEVESRRLCGNCGERAVRPYAVPGRTMLYKEFGAVPVPADLLIPTCEKCGVEWLDHSTAKKLDEALAREVALRSSGKEK